MIPFNSSREHKAIAKNFFDVTFYNIRKRNTRWEMPAISYSDLKQLTFLFERNSNND